MYIITNSKFKQINRKKQKIKQRNNKKAQNKEISSQDSFYVHVPINIKYISYKSYYTIACSFKPPSIKLIQSQCRTFQKY